MHHEYRRGAGWSKLSALALALALSGCSSERPGQEVVEVDDGSLRGELVVFVVNFDDETSETRFALRVGGDERNERRLVFSAAPDLASGTRVKVWGRESSDQIDVERWEVDRGAAGERGTSSEALIGAPPYPAKSFAWIFVDIGGGTNLTEALARQRLVGTNPGDNSVKQYYQETSYGTQDITAQFFGPFSYPMNGCDTSAMASALRSQVPGTFNHYLWYFGSRTSACSWSGLAQLGAPDRPARDTWYNGSSNCVVLVQEPGHNFGMAHSSSLDCGTNVLNDDPNTCTHSEYGDRFDPMGGGCDHTNAWQKVYQGWLDGCNSVRVGQSGTYTLFPLENACNGIQVLQIPMTRERPFTKPAAGGGGSRVITMRHYYLELRASYGFDSGIANTVLVHIGDNYRSRTQSGYQTWILDMNPSTSAFDGLRQGESYTDPAGGVSFAVESISTTRASIRVEVPNGTGSSTCLDGATVAPPGPADCGSGGAAGTSGAGGVAGTSGAGGVAGTSGAGGVAGTSGAGGVAGTSGAGGVAGTSGAGGVAGTSGAGGDAGTNGRGGTDGVGGTAGGAGTDGVGGIGGSSGSSGTGAAGGVGGSTGVGGDAGVGGVGGTGAGGVPAGGASGRGGAAGVGGPGVGGAGAVGGAGGSDETSIPIGPELELNDNDGACACKTGSTEPRPGTSGWLLGLALAGLLKRRRKGAL